MTTNTNTQTKSAAAVARGVDYLDNNFPNWANHISLDTFDIASSGYCVVAQLFPNEHGIFSVSVGAMWEEFDTPGEADPYGWAGRYGFDQTPATSCTYLQVFWEEAIIARQTR